MGVTPMFEGDFGRIRFTPNFAKYMAMVQYRAIYGRGKKRKLWRELHDELTNALNVLNREMYVAGEDPDSCLVPTKFVK